jgi:type IV pilus assembly protein PilM
LEARKHIPLDGSSTVIDYQILGEHPKEADKVRVLIAATTTKLFESHADILRDLELKPGVVDIDQLAAMNSFVINRDIPEEGVVIFLNLGTRKTNLTVFGRTDLFFTREIAIAGHAFTEELMKTYGLTYGEAERIKIEQGMNPELEVAKDGSEGKSFRVAAKSTMEKLGDEINRSLRYYVKESGQSYFTQIILTGGTSGLKGLDTMLEEKFNLPVEIYDPFMALGESSNGNYGPQFAVAVGLALRGD